MGDNKFIGFEGRIKYVDVPPPPSNPKPVLRPPFKRPGEPERFRLAGPTKYFFDKTFPPDQNLSFWFRTRVVSATGTLSHPWHDNVLRLRLHPSRIARFFERLAGFLPFCVSSWIRALFPEWFLPPIIILKTEKQGEDWEGVFDTELKAYNRLRSLQGVIVPRCYGITRYNGMRSLILQDVGGACLTEPAGLMLDFPELSSLLQSCQRELHTYGVHQEDPQPGNFRLVNGKLMALDLEMVAFDLSDEEKDHFIITNTTEIADKYRRLQLLEWKKGHLVAA